MKAMEKFGVSLADYEGVAEATYKEDPTSRIGHFEAKQSVSGRIAIAFLPAESCQSGQGSGMNPRLAFTGQDTGGWELETIGYTFPPGDNFEPSAQPRELSFSPERLRARKIAAPKAGCSEARFLLSNMLWHRIGRPEPEPIEPCVSAFGRSPKPPETTCQERHNGLSTNPSMA